MSVSCWSTISPPLHGLPHRMKGSEEVPLSLWAQKDWSAHSMVPLESGALSVAHGYFQLFISSE